jgi:glycosyltransferase involved in cell wall biosynthesis
MMKIAIVVPFIPKIEGNRMAFLIARELAINNETIVFAHSTLKSLRNEIEVLLGASHFRSLNFIDHGKYGLKFALNYQLLRKKSRELAAFIIESGNFDHVILIANESHWLPYYLKKNSKMKVHLLLMELHDHGMISLQRGNLKLAMARNFLTSPLYGLFKIFERQRFAMFDTVFANSTWTKTIFEYLYGIRIRDIVFATDLQLFSPSDHSHVSERFIVVPTASLKSDPSGQEIVKRLVKDGIPIRTYGSYKIPGVNNLGFLSDTEMVRLLTSASATLFLFNYEALGLIPFESLACGTPVITYDKQGPSLELRSNPNVYFIGSYEGLRDLCSRLLSEDKGEPVIKACRDSVMRYGSEEVVKRLEKQLLSIQESFSNS